MLKVIAKGFAYILVVFFIILGILGIFLPLLPSVPFFLLAVLIAVKISKRNIVRIKKIPIIGERIYKTFKDFRRRRKRKVL